MLLKKLMAAWSLYKYFIPKHEWNRRIDTVSTHVTHQASSVIAQVQVLYSTCTTRKILPKWTTCRNKISIAKMTINRNLPRSSQSMKSLVTRRNTTAISQKWCQHCLSTGTPQRSVCLAYKKATINLTSTEATTKHDDETTTTTTHVNEQQQQYVHCHSSFIVVFTGTWW